MKKHILCLMVALVLLMLPGMTLEAEAAEIVASGTCGEDLTWTLDDAGTLTISGTGDMADYDSGTAPWYGQRTKIKSVVIEDGITDIGSYAFYGCVKMTGITIADSVTYCGFYAFEKCSSLTDVYITDVAAWLNIYFWEDLFGYNSAHLLCANSLEKKLYLDDKLITHLVIPEGVTTISEYAFYQCSSLKSVTIPEGVTTIGAAAFSYCSSLESVTIPDSVTDIDSYTFSGCNSLESVTIPDSVTDIDSYTFSGCNSLESVIIPEGVTTIGYGAFSDCIGLKRVTIPDSVTEIDDRIFSDCSSLESVTIGNGVAEISFRAFENCSSLKSVTIPDGVSEIHQEAFSGCSSLMSVTLPDSVTDIGYEAFSHCINLTTVHYGGTQEQAAIISDNEYLTDATWHYECSGIDCIEPEPPRSPDNPFGDVAQDAYYFAPVLWAVENGITNGLSEDAFGPEATCTRGQIVTFLWRANGSPDPKMVFNPFSDVSSSDYFYKAVLWAVENGITSGMGDGSFAPGAPCTRGQVATFLWRACGQPAPSGTNIFTDIAPGAYYYDAVLWAVEQGITNGMGDGTFAPDAPCTRGQIVTFLCRAMT